MMATIPPFVKSGQRFTATHMVKIKMKKMERMLQRESESDFLGFVSSFGKDLTCNVVTLGEDDPFCCVLEIADRAHDVTSGEDAFSVVYDFDSPAAVSLATTDAAWCGLEQCDPQYCLSIFRVDVEAISTNTRVSFDTSFFLGNNEVDAADAGELCNDDVGDTVGHVSSFCSGAVLAPVIGATINVMAATIAIVIIVV